jgi:hypothetical protein
MAEQQPHPQPQAQVREHDDVPAEEQPPSPAAFAGGEEKDEEEVMILSEGARGEPQQPVDDGLAWVGAVGAVIFALGALAGGAAMSLRSREVLYTPATLAHPASTPAADHGADPPPPMPEGEAAPGPGLLSAAEVTALKLSLWHSRAQLRETRRALEEAAVRPPPPPPPRGSGGGSGSDRGGGSSASVATVGVDRRSNLSFAEFNRSYAAARRPVVITDYAERERAVSILESVHLD